MRGEDFLSPHQTLPVSLHLRHCKRLQRFKPTVLGVPMSTAFPRTPFKVSYPKAWNSLFPASQDGEGVDGGIRGTETRLEVCFHAGGDCAPHQMTEVQFLDSLFATFILFSKRIHKVSPNKLNTCKFLKTLYLSQWMSQPSPSYARGG